MSNFLKNDKTKEYFWFGTVSLLASLSLGWLILVIWNQAEIIEGGAGSIFFSLWIPLAYLFFLSLYGLLYFLDVRENFAKALRLNSYTYLLSLIFLILEISWKGLGNWKLWFGVFFLLLISAKAFLLIRYLYQNLDKFPLSKVKWALFFITFLIYLLISPWMWSSHWEVGWQKFIEAVLSGWLSKGFFLDFLAALLIVNLYLLSREITNSQKFSFFIWLFSSFAPPMLLAISQNSLLLLISLLLVIFILRKIKILPIYSWSETKKIIFNSLTGLLAILLFPLSFLLVLNSAWNEGEIATLLPRVSTLPQESLSLKEGTPILKKCFVLSSKNNFLEIKVPGDVDLSSSLIFISNLSNAITVSQRAKIAELTVIGDKGISQKFGIFAGVDTSEWAIDKRDVKRVVKHQRAKIADTWIVTTPLGETFEAHHYYTEFGFNKPLEPQRIQIQFTYSPKKTSGFALNIKNVVFSSLLVKEK
jgi:hypothetical protein